MKLLFALPGFHRYDRGAEVALLSVADAIARGGDSVTVMGSGEARPAAAYQFRSIASIRRERFEHFPTFRSEEHTSELQSLMRISYAVFCLKKINNQSYTAA